jgi:RNA polymerase sigma-70 factor (ECF subfamily)
MGRQLQGSDDFALMSAIAAGDRGAISALYDRHAPLLLALCRRILRDQADAEDVLTDVFFEVWSRADRFDPSRGSPVTYLVTLARSRSIDRRRARAARGGAVTVSADAADAAALVSASPNPSQSTEADEQRRIVRAALACLEPQQREAIECSFYEGLSHSEIAEKLGKPLGTVKTYIRQGLIRLRDRLRIPNGNSA